MVLKKEKKEKILFLFSFIIISFFFRVWNITEWKLPQLDELNLVDKLHQPSSTFKVTTCFFPTLFLTKIFFFFIKSFPYFRYIGAAVSILSTIFIFLSLNMLTKNPKIAFIGVTLLSLNGWFLENNRLYLVNNLSYLICSILIFLYFKWEKSKKDLYIPLMFLLLGLTIVNYSTTLYFAFPFFLWFCYLVIKREIKFRTFVISVIFLLIMSIPFFLGVMRDKKFFNVYLPAIQQITEEKFMGPTLINIIHPEFLLEHLNELLFPIHIFNPTLSLKLGKIITFLVISIPLFIYTKIKSSNRNLKFLLWLTYGTLLTPLFSIILVNDHTHLFFFLIILSCLFGLELSFHHKIRRLIFIPISIILFSNLVFSISLISENESEKVGRYIKDIGNLTIDAYAYHMLKYTHHLDNIQKIKFFECHLHTKKGPDGIYSVDKEEIINFPHGNEGVYNPNFFSPENCSKGDIIIYASNCYHFDEEIKKDLSMKLVYGLEELKIYEVV